MKYANINGIELPVSRIIYGTASAKFLAGEDCNEMLDTVSELGVTTIDTARVYGEAEKSIGNWLRARNNRKDVVILSKGGHPSEDGTRRISEKEIRYDLELSLEKLGTDFIDIYLLHRDDEDIPVGEIVEWLNALHKEGKIGEFGGSNWTHERIAEANEYAEVHGLKPFTISSPNYGIAEQVRDPWGGGCVTVSGKSNPAREWYEQTQMPLIAYSALAHGLFSGRVKSADAARAAEVLDEAAIRGYGCEENFERLRRCEEMAKEKGVTVAQIAMAYIFGSSMNCFAVVSASTRERMENNIEALETELTQEECKYLNLEI